MENLDFYLNEIVRLEPEYPDSWETIFRYFVKINTVLSNEAVSTKTVTDFIGNFSEKVKNEEIQTIANVFFSEIFYNRAVPLKNKRIFGEVNFKELPDFVDKNRVKTKKKKKDPSFEAKNIEIRTGWLDLKSNKSFDV